MKLPEVKYRLLWLVGILCFLLLLFMLPREFDNASNQKSLPKKIHPDSLSGQKSSSVSDIRLKNPDQNSRPNDGSPKEPKVIDIETHPLNLDAAAELSSLIEESNRYPDVPKGLDRDKGEKEDEPPNNPNVTLDQLTSSQVSSGLPDVANLVGINWLVSESTNSRVSPLQFALRDNGSLFPQPRKPKRQVYYNQSGVGNDFEQDVDFSSLNDRYITQVGLQNFAWQRLYNTTFSDMTIRSIGNFNRVSQIIYNGYHQNLRVIQNGSYNVADQDIYSTNIKGSFERSSNIIRQIGRYNIARTLSYGASNELKVTQNGSRNSARVDQKGNNNSVDITQVGSGNSIVIEQH